jgi:hypothetical protein
LKKDSKHERSCEGIIPAVTFAAHALAEAVLAQDVHVYVVDSIICRLTITPRESEIMIGASDDNENVLLLYFGQKWGKPELYLDPPLPTFRWKTGNIQMRGFIRRGYPMWVLEG